MPTPTALLAQLGEFRDRLAPTSPLVFASEKNPAVPMNRHLFDKWLSTAERAAGLEKLEGALWHAYRRKWAS